MNVRTLAKCISVMFAFFALAGCATTQKIDWSARLGLYTYDQAMADFGKPNDSTKSADGGTVADWLIERGHAEVPSDSRFVTPGSFTGPRMPTLGQPYFPNYYMRLTFGTDGRLKEHGEFAR